MTNTGRFTLFPTGKADGSAVLYDQEAARVTVFTADELASLSEAISALAGDPVAPAPVPEPASVSTLYPKPDVIVEPGRVADVPKGVSVPGTANRWLEKMTLMNYTRDEHGNELIDVELPPSNGSVNVITSETSTIENPEADILSQRNMHAPLFDLDFPCELIPSSTPGHFHLYMDKEIPYVKMLKVMAAMVDAGLVQEGYYNSVKAHDAAILRLPWIKKGGGNA